LLLVAALILALVPLGARPAVADEPRYGIVTGRVVAASDGATTLADTRVTFIGQDGVQRGQAQANYLGEFTQYLPTGQYYVHFVPFSNRGTPYADLWWESSADREHAQLITVTSEQPVSLTAALPLAATVSGVAYVDHAYPGSSFEGYVRLTDCATGGARWTDASASTAGSPYTMSGVPPGTYSARWEPKLDGWGETSLFPGYYSGTYDENESQLITVGRGQNVTGIDIHGTMSGTLDGFTYFNDAWQPSQVSLYDLNGTLLDVQYTDSGYWYFSGLRAGQYKVHAHMFLTGASGWAENARDFASASVLNVSLGETTKTWVKLALPASSNQPQSMGQAPDAGTSAERATTGHFADVTTANPFYDPIEWTAASGISTGTLDPPNKPLYKPLDPMSRQAFAAFLYRYSGITFNPPQFSTFDDVGPDNPFYAAIEWMAANGYTTGTPQRCGKPLFDPEGTISRQATAAFLARFAQVTPAAPTTQVFADVPNDAFFASYIDWMGVQGISTGTPQPGGGLPLYKPTDPVTRQEVAAFLYRFDNL